MKIHKLMAAAVTVVCTCLCLCLPARAVDLDDPRFKDKTWEQVMTEFLAEHDVAPDSVTAGYYNTVTGQEYYWNEGQYMYAASVVKLPTNMIYAERIYNGEMDWDTPVRGTAYKTIQETTLVFSNNEMQNAMVGDLGGGIYAEFRKTLLPYIGLAQEDMPEDFLRRSIFTPEQMIYCLKLLYSDPDRYPGVIDKMLLANPGWYFESKNPSYEVAHKYGWYTLRGVTYINDVGIVYTDDPILLVMFTGSVDDALGLLGEYCNLMCDYTQYHRALRYTEDAAAKPVAVPTPLTFVTAEEAPADSLPLYVLLCVGGVAGAAVGAVLLWNRKLWAAVLPVAGAVLLWFGLQPILQVQQALTDGTPAAAVESFAAELVNGEYDDPLTALAWSVFDLTVGTPVGDGLRIVVPVTAVKLDVDKVNAALETAYTAAVTQLAAADQTGLYDADGSFCVDVADAAAAEAVSVIADERDRYLTTVEGTVTLQHTNHGWQVVPDEELARLCNYES